MKKPGPVMQRERDVGESIFKIQVEKKYYQEIKN